MVLISTIGFSLMPFFARHAYLGKVTVFTLLLIRFLAAAGCFFFYIRMRWMKIELNLATVKSLFMVGALFCSGESVLYYSAIKYIPVSLAVLILYIYPILVFLFSVFIRKRATFTLASGLSILLCFGGLIPLIGVSVERLNLVGIFCAVGAAFLDAGYILSSERLVKSLPSVVASGFVTLFTALGLGVIGSLGGTLNFNFKPEAWWPMAGLVLFSTLFSLFTFYKALELLGPVKTAVLSMTEPIFTVLFSIIFLGERFSAIQVLGGFCVLTGVFLVLLQQNSE